MAVNVWREQVGIPQKHRTGAMIDVNNSRKSTLKPILGIALTSILHLAVWLIATQVRNPQYQFDWGADLLQDQEIVETLTKSCTALNLLSSVIVKNAQKISYLVLDMVHTLFSYLYNILRQNWRVKIFFCILFS